MILTADAALARRTRRRPANEGWNTAFIGANRYTRGEGDPLPDPDAIYPMAFLVEKQPGAVVRPHFHQADQFQVVVAGGGALGTHEVGPVAVHYTERYSAYGPIRAGDEGIAWFTLRNAWDPGAKYMPAHRAELRAARARHAHREATVAPEPALGPAALAALDRPAVAPVLDARPDGLGAWRYRLPPGAAVHGPAPAAGGGQFWLVLGGRAGFDDREMLGLHSCAFVAPDAPGGATAQAGAEGAELLCMQFPRARPN